MSPQGSAGPQESAASAGGGGEVPRPPEGTEAAWGAPPAPGAPRWSWRKTLVAAAIAVGIAGVGGVAVYAASTAAGEHTGRGGGGPMIRMAGGPGDLAMLHGEGVVKKDGEFVIQLTQNGEVTEITPDSITVRSEDDYTKTYALGPDTDTETIATGDQVMIMATPTGDAATADTVIDMSEMGKGGFNQKGPGGPQVHHDPGGFRTP